MRSRISPPLRVALAFGLLAVLLSIGVLAATASPPGRSSLLRELQKPATTAAASVGPGPVSTVIPAGPYKLGLALTPNRAGVRDHLSVTLTAGARPVRGAQITVVFSMPVMNMWQALTTRLATHSTVAYTADEPVLGMAGMWQMRLRVAPRNGPSFDLTVNDHMGA